MPNKVDKDKAFEIAKSISMNEGEEIIVTLYGGVNPHSGGGAHMDGYLVRKLRGPLNDRQSYSIKKVHSDD